MNQNCNVPAPGGGAAHTGNWCDLNYVKYAATRLAAFRNVWWSMANEWDFNLCKGRGVDKSLRPPSVTASPVWDDLFQFLRAEDPYQRQMSIHNGELLYNHSRPWISHVSLQGLEDQTEGLRLS